MANYRAVYLKFWSDSKVMDDFTPEDRYIYLYLLTNTHTNLCGCYEVSLKTISTETGYAADAAEKVLRRLSNDHQVVSYNGPTKELLIINWHKYNWSVSEKINRTLLAEIQAVKCDRFRQFLLERFNERETVETPVPFVPGDQPKKPKVERHKYGAYGWVRLSDDEYARLTADLGEAELQRCITYIDESAQSNGNKNKWKDWNLVIRKCSREGWGGYRKSQAQTKPTTLDSLQSLHSMFQEEEQ